VPTRPYSRGWGYAPSGIGGALLIVLLILVLIGQILRTQRSHPTRDAPDTTSARRAKHASASVVSGAAQLVH
jgi:hypothetical protein